MATYLYEQSGPDRFQQLAQALLLEDFPQLQCFPIGQQDGGRDGLDRVSGTVLQVKFKRADESENADWMIRALEGELEKVKALHERGAERYIMITNASGTGHLDSGRIDKVQQWLDVNMPIPATCFWRDEVDRRMDKAQTSLILRYSEVLTLQNGLDAALALALAPALSAREDALRAFVKRQFDRDRSVKFKQVSLSNELLNLFIDVPVGIPHGTTESRREANASRSYIEDLARHVSGQELAFWADEATGEGNIVLQGEAGSYRVFHLNAADLLLSPRTQDALDRVLIQGAPGQGKSTIAQYICQVHRARFLQDEGTLAQLPHSRVQSTFRLPIKIDLRDFASFVSGASPFESAAAPSSPLTLDVFLSQVIAYESGGLRFEALDVLNVIKAFPVLLFFDGLDEVADLAVREQLLKLIDEAVHRWSAFDARVQVIVTSRPSIFGRALDFKKLGYRTLSLKNITREAIEDYAGKWIAARGLDEAEGLEVTKILAEKMQLPHIIELTRNPMQLTILLSLIHQVGHSLPDQRTELYTKYLDLFLIREADKSQAVRQFRQVLLNFIGFLAWKLQTAAESEKGAGSISEREVQAEARAYLSAEGRSPDVADELFSGGLERIFVLVQRIEGLYEFEVQPLREYFCAQYLYETAPVATFRGAELHGDRAQRFEALVANPFWLNVCRFYAGFCVRGETGNLVLSLKQLMASADKAAAAHARRVGLALLRDWVFSNVKFAQEELIKAICEERGLVTLVQGERSADEQIILNVECGRDALRDTVFQVLARWPLSVQAGLICDLLYLNGGAHLTGDFVKQMQGLKGPDRTRVFNRMVRSGATSDFSGSSLWELIVADSPNEVEQIDRCVVAVTASPQPPRPYVEMRQIHDTAVRGALDGAVQEIAHGANSMSRFISLVILEPTPLVLGGIPLLIHRGFGPVEHDVEVAAPAVVAFLSELDAAPELVTEGSLLQQSQYLLHVMSKHFSNSQATYSMAVMFAGLPSTGRGAGGSSLFDGGISIYDRVRSARLRRGGSAWWTEQFEMASSPLEKRFWVSMVLAWARAELVVELTATLESVIAATSHEEYEALVRLQSAIVAAGLERSDRKLLETVDVRGLSPRLAVLVAAGVTTDEARIRFSLEQLHDPEVQQFISDCRAVAFITGAPTTEDLDAELQWARDSMAVAKHRPLLVPAPRQRRHRLPSSPAVTDAVLDDPLSYTTVEVQLAVHAGRTRLRALPLRAVAEKQEWQFV